MPKEDNEDVKNSTKCWIWDNDYTDNDIILRGHCHITGKYRSSVHRDCNINLKLNHKTPIVFHNLKNYDSHLTMQELGKFNLKITVIPIIPNIINNKLNFIDSFQFLSFSLDSLVKNLNKDDLKNLSQEFDNNVLDLVKQKGFYPYEYMSDFEKFKEKLPSKEKFYSSLTDRKLLTKDMNMLLTFGKCLKQKQ